MSVLILFSISVTIKHQALLPNRNDDDRSTSIMTPYLGLGERVWIEQPCYVMCDNWTVQTTNLPSSELLISCHFSFCIKKMLNNLAHVPYHNFFPFVLHFNGKCYLAFWLNTSPCQGLHARLIFRGGHSGLNKYNMFNIVIINLTISKVKKSNSVPIFL